MKLKNIYFSYWRYFFYILLNIFLPDILLLNLPGLYAVGSRYRFFLLRLQESTGPQAQNYHLFSEICQMQNGLMVPGNNGKATAGGEKVLPPAKVGSRDGGVGGGGGGGTEGLQQRSEGDGSTGCGAQRADEESLQNVSSSSQDDAYEDARCDHGDAATVYSGGAGAPMYLAYGLGDGEFATVSEADAAATTGFVLQAGAVDWQQLTAADGGQGGWPPQLQWNSGRLLNSPAKSDVAGVDGSSQLHADAGFEPIWQQKSPSSAGVLESDGAMTDGSPRAQLAQHSRVFAKGIVTPPVPLCFRCQSDPLGPPTRRQTPVDY